jgi:dTMP kinase
MKGAFITIYGINNIGKTTHAKLLTERLKREGYDAVYLKYPIYKLEPTGPIINSILRSDSPQKISEEELQTLFMQNRKDFEPELKEMIEAGKIIIAEDYTGTGIAWGTVKGLKQDLVENLNVGLLKEDFTILMRGKRDVKVIEVKHIHENNQKWIDGVGIILDEIGKKKGWKVVELRPKIQDTADAIWLEVKKFLDDRAGA